MHLNRDLINICLGLSEHEVGFCDGSGHGKGWSKVTWRNFEGNRLIVEIKILFELGIEVTLKSFISFYSQVFESFIWSHSQPFDSFIWPHSHHSRVSSDHTPQAFERFIWSHSQAFESFIWSHSQAFNKLIWLHSSSTTALPDQTC